MNHDLQKERTQTVANWAKREKQIYKVMENTASLYGDVKGIAGRAVQSIKSLEDGDEVENLLREAN